MDLGFQNLQISCFLGSLRLSTSQFVGVHVSDSLSRGKQTTYYSPNRACGVGVLTGLLKTPTRSPHEDDVQL